MQVQVYVKKAEAKYEADFTALPKVTQDYLVAYGWRQAIADAAAGAKNKAEAKGACDKRFDNLSKGIVRAERETDPVGAEAKRLAIAIFNRKVKDGLSVGEDKVAETIAAIRANPKVQAQAEANVAAMAGLDLDVSL